jgi:hypothetical protein
MSCASYTSYVIRIYYRVKIKARRTGRIVKIVNRIVV